MRCDKCKEKIDQDYDDWQKLNVSEMNFWLCSECVKELMIFLEEEE